MRFRTLYDDGLACLRFFTRLPWLPAVRPDGAAAATSARLLPAALVPVAGLMIGLCPAAVLEVALALDLTPDLAAALAIAGLVAVTGALHEDGLADCADGFGGGWDRDRKLAIMRDSRIGTYGVCALVFSLLIRTLAIGALAGRAPIAAAAGLIVVAAWSRTACLLPLIVLPPARRDGLGASTSPPTWREMMPAGLICLAAWLCLPMCGIPVTRALAALVLAPAAAIGVCRLALHQIGGQTGDVAGAAQQAAEIAAFLALATA